MVERKRLSTPPPVPPATPTAQAGDKYIVRFPDGMREQIAEAAKANNRSMNGEIIERLQNSLGGQQSPDVAVVLARLQLDVANLQFDLRRAALEASHLKYQFNRVLHDHAEIVEKTISLEGIASAKVSCDRLDEIYAKTQNADILIPLLHQRQAELISAEVAFRESRGELT